MRVHLHVTTCAKDDRDPDTRLKWSGVVRASLHSFKGTHHGREHEEWHPQLLH